MVKTASMMVQNGILTSCRYPQICIKINAKFSSVTLQRRIALEKNDVFIIDSFNFFDVLTSQVQIEKKPNPFTVTKLNAVLIGVFTYHPKYFDWITGSDKS